MLAQPLSEIGEILENPQGKAADYQRDAEENEEAHALLQRPWREAAARRRIKHGQAEAGNCEDEEQQTPG